MLAAELQAQLPQAQRFRRLHQLRPVAAADRVVIARFLEHQQRLLGLAAFDEAAEFSRRRGAGNFRGGDLENAHDEGLAFVELRQDFRLPTAATSIGLP